MRIKQIMVSCILVLIFIISCEENTTKSKRIEQGYITGTVVDLNSNEPVSNAIIQIDSTLSYTDQNGNYIFNDIPFGTYVLFTKAYGFLDFEKEIIINEDSLIFDIIMEPKFGCVNGRVRKKYDNSNITNAIIQIDSITDTTDSEGYYHLENVPFGLHIITATSPGLQDFEKEINIENDVTNFDITMELKDFGTIWEQLDYPLDNMGKINCIENNNTSDLLIGTDNGLYLSTSRGEGNWTQTLDQPVYTIFSSGRGNIYAGGNDLYLSEDNGSTWLLIDTLGTEFSCISIVETETGRLIMTIRKPDDNLNFTGFNKSLFSDDTAKTWTELDICGDAFDVLRTWNHYIGNENLILSFYRGDMIAELFASFDNGNSWEDIDNNVPGNLNRFSGLGNNNEIYIWPVDTEENNLFKSNNYGESWKELSRKGTIHVTPNNNIIITSIHGAKFYKSFDGGETWIPYDSGITNALAPTLMFTSDENYIYIVSTYTSSHFWRSIHPEN